MKGINYTERAFINSMLAANRHWIVFTHFWATGKGWQESAGLFRPEQFPTIEEIGRMAKTNESIFSARTKTHQTIVFRGYIDADLNEEFKNEILK